mmetsp:Transcript_42305/g.78774  ORF Transcript_42305/g.78774 Transcript_42305/m.78774 type:complete len:269 (+) Transcript_42305:61-867(+)
MPTTHEDAVRLACSDCLRSWHGTGSPSSCIHPSCSVLQVEMDGTWSSKLGSEFRFPSEFVSDQIIVETVQVLQVGSKSAASVHARLGEHVSVWLVFLQLGPYSQTEVDRTWQCISVAVAGAGQVTSPLDFADISGCVWDGYCRANRACDGRSMADYFHETCRLTYSDADFSLVVKDCATFCDMVSNRYSTPLHQDYAHLQDDPRVGSRDSLLSIDFGSLASPIAMVVLTVAHPPCLWTDLLTVAKLQGKWWVVHKSSCQEPFLAEEKK